MKNLRLLSRLIGTLCSVAVVLLLLLCGCNRRELTYEYYPYCDVTLFADWSASSVSPTGMSVYCFPQDGSTPLLITTNNVRRTHLPLREGVYDILLFNQSVNEFGTLSFAGMDGFATAGVHAAPFGTATLHTTSKGDESLSEQPEQLAVARHTCFEVTAEMVEASALYRDDRYHPTDTTHYSLTLTPQDVVMDGIILVRVHGIQNLRSLTASFSGLASGIRLADDSPLPATATHPIDSWQKSVDDGDYTKGTLRATYTTFGLPADAATLKPEDLILSLSVLLVDDETVINREYPVGDLIKVISTRGGPATELALYLEIGITSGFPPLELPDVKPSGSTDSGFGVDVDGWGDDEQIDVPM